MANPFGQPQPPIFGQPIFGQPQPPVFGQSDFAKQPTYDQFTSKFNPGVTSFAPTLPSFAEPSLTDILDKLTTTHPNFPVYMKRFKKPYFIFENQVTYHSKKYIVYARKIYDSIELTKSISAELKDFHPSDLIIEKSSSF
jgi:hypothetical protein